MKKRIIIALIFAVICASFASADAYKDVNGLISRGLTEQNIQMIKELSPQLTQSQKNSIYTWKRVSPITGAAMNLFLGFGSGSSMQGDKLHGTIFMIGDVICTGLIVFDLIKHSGEEFNHSLYGGDKPGEMTLAIIGLVGAAGLRVWQTIQPIVYARQYNAKLRDALGMDNPTFAMLPVYTKDGLGLTLSARIPLN